MTGVRNGVLYASVLLVVWGLTACACAELALPCSPRSSRSSPWHVEHIWRDHCQEPRVSTRVFVAGIVAYLWRLWGASAEAMLASSGALGWTQWTENLTLALEPSNVELGTVEVGDAASAIAGVRYCPCVDLALLTRCGRTVYPCTSSFSDVQCAVRLPATSAPCAPAYPAYPCVPRAPRVPRVPRVPLIRSAEGCP